MIAALLARPAIALGLKIAPWMLALAMGFAFSATRLTLKQERAEHRTVLAELQREAAEATARNAVRVAAAAETYATRTAALKPLIVRSTNEVTRYAETPAGAHLCRDAERVRSIDALDAELRNPGAAGGGEGTVPSDPAAPPG